MNWALQSAIRQCLPPDSTPRPPIIEVPHGAWDCHAHIFGSSFRYPYKPNRRYTPAATGIEDYRYMVATLGIERAVIVQSGVYVDNQATMDALASSNGRWRGIAALKPDVTEVELDRLHKCGFRGVRFHLRHDREGLRYLNEVAAKIKPLGWHVQLHFDGRDLVELGSQLNRLPVNIVIDHFGHIPIEAGTNHPGFKILLGMLKDGHCWIKLSGPYRFSDPRPPYSNLIPFAQALINAAPERALWASDWPHNGRYGNDYMPNDGELLDLLELWAPDPKIRRQILVENPKALYDSC